MTIKIQVHQVMARVHRVIGHFQERVHLSAECTYLFAVSIEAHGFYAYAAMILLTVTVVGVIVKVEE